MFNKCMSGQSFTQFTNHVPFVVSAQRKSLDHTVMERWLVAHGSETVSGKLNLCPLLYCSMLHHSGRTSISGSPTLSFSCLYADQTFDTNITKCRVSRFNELTELEHECCSSCMLVLSLLDELKSQTVYTSGGFSTLCPASPLSSMMTMRSLSTDSFISHHFLLVVQDKNIFQLKSLLVELTCLISFKNRIIVQHR